MPRPLINLRKLMDDRGITIEALSQKAGLSASTINRYRGGRLPESEKEVEWLAIALDCKVNDLCAEDKTFRGSWEGYSLHLLRPTLSKYVLKNEIASSSAKIKASLTNSFLNQQKQHQIAIACEELEVLRVYNYVTAKFEISSNTSITGDVSVLVRKDFQLTYTVDGKFESEDSFSAIYQGANLRSGGRNFFKLTTVNGKDVLFSAFAGLTSDLQMPISGEACLTRISETNLSPARTTN